MPEQAHEASALVATGKNQTPPGWRLSASRLRDGCRWVRQIDDNVGTRYRSMELAPRLVPMSLSTDTAARAPPSTLAAVGSQPLRKVMSEEMPDTHRENEGEGDP